VVVVAEGDKFNSDYLFSHEDYFQIFHFDFVNHSCNS